MFIISFLLAVASATLLVAATMSWGRARARRRQALDRALSGLGRQEAAGARLPTGVTHAPFTSEDGGHQLFPYWLLHLGGRLACLASRLVGEEIIHRAHRTLVLAGEPPGLGPDRLIGMQAGLATIGGIVGAVLWVAGMESPLLTALLFMGGGAYPWMRVHLLALRRQEQIGRELPDFLDLLAVALGAGAGLDAALASLTARLRGPLADELRRYQGEVALGSSRASALRRLRERNQSRDLDWFVTTLAQAHSLGAPLAAMLAAEASYLRKTRLARARERAAQATPRMTLVTTLIATPGALIFFLGLLLLSIWEKPTEFGLTGVLLGP